MSNISRKKASIINLLFNYSNSLFGIINGLVLMPMYLKYFSISTYGSFLSSGNIIALLGLLDGGMAYVLTQKLSDSYSKKKINDFSKILGSGLFISVIVFLILVILGFSILPFISNWVKSDPLESKNIQIAFIISAVGAGLGIFFHNISAVFQSILKVKISGYTNLISIIFGITSTIISLRNGLGVISIPLGLLIRNLIGVFILIIYLWLTFKRENFPPLSINKENIKDLTKSVVPMIGGGLAKSLVSNSQLLIITSFINPTASAVFFITSRIFMVCDSFLAPISSSIFSSISQIFAEGNKIKIQKNINNVYFIFNLFSAFILSLSFVMNNSFINLFLGKEKYGGLLLSTFLCINMLLYTRFTFISTNLFALGVFGKTIFIDIISGVFRIFLIFALISQLGYLAVPIAELVSTIFLMGFYLNKLITNRLEIYGKEAFKFVFSGLKIFVIASIVAFAWLLIVPLSHNWFVFIIESILYCFFIFASLYLFEQNFRNLIYEIISMLKIKIFKIWT